MKNLFLFIAMAIVAMSCQLQNLDNDPSVNSTDLSSARTTSIIPGNYQVSSTTTDGKTFTIQIDQSCAQDISHLLFQFTDCDGNYLTVDNVVSVTVNGTAWPYSGTTGSGTNCAFDNSHPFIKLDNFNFEGGIVTVVFTFDTQAAQGAFLIKSGQNCYPYQIAGQCDEEKCYEYKNETAWAAGTRYTSKGNWATYTSYSGVYKSVTLYAGQNINIGTVTFTPSGGNVLINISLKEGWSLQDVSEGVKIQGYNVAPSGNPAPGLFTTYKGNDLSVTVPAYAFYGVHIDARYQKEIACEL